jgi:4a-hydroxytetrahydrobiopterin dehydratase
MKLTEPQIADALRSLPEWTVSGGKLHREYRLASFAHAIGFLCTAAFAIERMDHHPEWSNVYSRVTVDLVTHSEGGITDKDLALAQVLEEVAGRFV